MAQHLSWADFIDVNYDAAAVERVSVDLSRAGANLHLDRRLREVPASARIRGIFFAMLRDGLRRRGLLSIPDVKRFVDAGHRSYRFYTAHEVMEAYALGGALVHADPREGIRELFSENVSYFTRTWYGEAMARFLKPDPTGALAWLERTREHVANYGRWRLERRSPTHAILHMFDEYFWIEAAQRGGCEGLLTACGLRGEVHAELDDDYNGRLDIRWAQRS
jgi:uncharacterized protein (TIGR02265 family)